jgi:hypothetical protein
LGIAADQVMFYSNPYLSPNLNVTEFRDKAFKEVIKVE